MESNPNNRKSLRLPHYNYSQTGFYFVTICCQNKQCLFGRVTVDKVLLNSAGKMINKWYGKLVDKFPTVKSREMIVMPNHVHFILEIIDNPGGHMGPPLPGVIQWFKTMTTNEYMRVSGTLAGSPSTGNSGNATTMNMSSATRNHTSILQIIF